MCTTLVYLYKYICMSGRRSQIPVLSHEPTLVHLFAIVLGSTCSTSRLVATCIQQHDEASSLMCTAALVPRGQRMHATLPELWCRVLLDVIMRTCSDEKTFALLPRTLATRRDDGTGKQALESCSHGRS